MCLSADITAARVAREALELSHQRLSSATELSAAVAYAMDRDLRCTWVHPAEVGKGVEEFLGKTLHDVFVTETADRLAGIYARVMRTGERVRFDFPVQSLFRPDPQHFDYAVEPLRDAGGVVTGIIVAARDITSRKRAEAASAQLAVIVASSSDAILSKTLDGTILTWNASAARLFGYSAEEMVGQPIARIIPPEFLDQESKILARLAPARRSNSTRLCAWPGMAVNSMSP